MKIKFLKLTAYQLHTTVWAIQKEAVHKTNERAIAAYKKQGFQIEGTRTKDLKYPNEVYIDTVLMGLHV